MASNELTGLTISQLAPKIKSRKVSPVEATFACLERIEEIQPIINSFITVFADSSIVQAKTAEKEIMQGNYRGPLHGIPIGIKDNLATKGIATTLGSKIMKNNMPDYDATVITKLKDAGAIFLGKENLHEFAMGVSCNNPHFGAIRNPWSCDCVPGGSSGGSASNVAAGATFASLGTDAGGSVRIPASACGVVGMKATYGRVSQRGLLTSAFNNDHVGPLTRSAKDNAIMLQAIAGFDALDATSVPLPVPNYLYRINGDIKGLKAGIPTNYYFEGLDPDVDKALKETIKALNDLGVVIKEVSLPNLEYAGALRIIGAAENVMMMDSIIREHRKDIGSDVLFRMLPGQFTTAIDYARCLRVQRCIIEDFTKALADVDFIITPTTPIPAFPIEADFITVGGTKIPVKGPGRGSAILGRNCFIGNHIGFPALSVPCGISEKGLPVGMQLIGRLFDEALLYRVANHYEEVSPMKGKHPEVKVLNR